MTIREAQVAVEPCRGTLIWYDVEPSQVVLECSVCDYVHIGSGVPIDVRHANCEVLRA